MELQVVGKAVQEIRRNESKITCATCKMKKCVGRCRWTKQPRRVA